jgi:hypothetical protein
MFSVVCNYTHYTDDVHYTGHYTDHAAGMMLLVALPVALHFAGPGAADSEFA